GTAPTGPVPDRGLARPFSVLALGAAVAVAVSGGVNGWLQVGSLEALWSTAYGRTLLAKVALFAAMVGLGWWNRARLAELAHRARRQVRVVRAETLLAAGAVGLTAGLIALVPGRELATEPYSATFEDGAGTVSVTVEPARKGTNALHLYFFDDARLSRPVDAAEARVSTGDLPPRRIDLVPITAGHYSASGFSLPTTGRWLFTITTVTRGVPAQLDFEVLVR
ncbi:MAG: hypothetical protein GEV08_10770, partial [Acidimicrobiia bacterium]|nr:hypothetical protein [Acidimicrobiia bacterium]